MDNEFTFLADEGFDKDIVLALREKYDVAYAAEFLQGADDEDVLKVAVKEQRILLTLDKDFGDLVFHSGQAHTGIILCRVQGLSATEKSDLVTSVVDKYGSELKNSFTVVQSKNVRIRKILP